MKCHDYTLHKRQFAEEESVAQDSEDGDCPVDESEMPALDRVVRIRQHSYCANLLCCRVGDGSHAHLPAENAEPADTEGEHFLVICWCKLRNLWDVMNVGQ